MESLKRITVLLLAAALVYAGAAALHPPKARAGINAGVVVNNLASQPVPITGNVGINGTAMVQLAPGTTVGVTGGTINFSNTPSTPIFTRDAGAQPVPLLDAFVFVGVGNPTSVGPVDISKFKEIRVWATTVNGVLDSSIFPVFPDPINTGEIVLLDDLNASKTGSGTKTYDTLWPSVSVLLVGGQNGPSQIHVKIYGRPN